MKSFFARREILALTLLLVWSLVIRLWRLDAFPDTLNPDEADTLQDALRIIYGAPRPHGFFGFDWKPQPAFSIYLFAGFLRIFGESIGTMRLPSALFSTMALVPFWWLVRRQTGKMAALGATFLLATNLWYLNFSRSGWENVHICLWMLAAMACVVKTLDSNFTTKAWMVGAAVFCALGLYGYFGGRVLLVATVVFLLSVSVTCPPVRRRALIATGCIGAGTVLLFLPQAWTIQQNFADFNSRTRTVLIFNSPQWQQTPLETAQAQLFNNTTGFWRGAPNQTPRYTPPGQPLLDYATGLLLAWGMLASVLLPRYRQRLETRLWWTMLLVSWGLTQLLSTNTPDGARGVGWMPTLFFFVALSLNGLIHSLNRLTRNSIAPRLIVAMMVFAIGLFNLTSYVRWQNDSATREARQPYVRKAEFEAWKTEVTRRAHAKEVILTVGEWRAQHP